MLVEAIGSFSALVAAVFVLPLLEQTCHPGQTELPRDLDDRLTWREFVVGVGARFQK